MIGHLLLGLAGAVTAGAAFAVAERILDWLLSDDRRARRDARRARRAARIAAARAAR